MTPRPRIAAGMAAALLWALAVVWLGARLAPDMALGRALGLALAGPGVALGLVIARLAQRRFFDIDLIDGQAPAVESPAEIDLRVLSNTAEQALLAVLLWPATGLLLGASGPGTVLALGLAFPLVRLTFWIGYHISPPARAFGFAATFYPTLLAFLWAVFQALT